MSKKTIANISSPIFGLSSTIMIFSYGSSTYTATMKTKTAAEFHPNKKILFSFFLAMYECTSRGKMRREFSYFIPNEKYTSSLINEMNLTCAFRF
jgi:hypothetical protein